MANGPHFDPHRSQILTITPGGVTTSAAIPLFGSSGVSITCKSVTGAVISGLKIKLLYTNFGGVNPQSGARIPVTAVGTTALADSGLWFVGVLGIQGYADGNYQDSVAARWMQIVLDDTSGASSGGIAVSYTIRVYDAGSRG